MPRIRSIKPEFFASQSVGRLSRDARLLFVGLWGQADDHGRFRAHPRLLAAALFAYDDDALRLLPRWLKELEAEGCIQLYEAGGDSYGAIPKWSEHQKIDKRADAKHPPPPIPPEKLGGSANSSRGVGDFPRKIALERKGEEGSREQGEEQGGAGAPVAEVPALPKEILPGRRVEDLQRAWNGLTSLPIPQWEQTSKGRKKVAMAALERRSLEGPSGWAAVFSRISLSTFCRGTNDRNWKADVDWALRPEGKKPETAQSVLEGKYDNPTNHAQPKGAATADDKRWDKPVATVQTEYGDELDLGRTAP